MVEKQSPDYIKELVTRLKHMEQHYFDLYVGVRKALKIQLDSAVAECPHENVIYGVKSTSFDYQGPTCNDCGAWRKVVETNDHEGTFSGEWYSTFRA